MAALAALTKPALPPYGATASAMVATPTIANAFALRNTVIRDPSTDATLLLADLRFHPSKRLIFYDSTLDQSVTLTLCASFDGTNFITVGSAQTVAIGSVTEQIAYIDSTVLGQLGNAYPFLGVQIKATVSPTVGSITVGLVAVSI